jgi:hypothetical protein
MSGSWSASLGEGQDVLSLEDGDFQEVLDQLTNFNQPQRDKCPLVRKLNVDASKEESNIDSKLNVSYTGNSGRKKNKASKQSSNRSCLEQERERGSSQSLQDLSETGDGSTSHGNGKRSRGMKGNRANSFSRDFTGNEHPKHKKDANWSSKNLTTSYSCQNHVVNNKSHFSDTSSSTPYSVSSREPSSNNTNDCDDSLSHNSIMRSPSSHVLRLVDQSKPCHTNDVDPKCLEEGSCIEMHDFARKAEIISYKSNQHHPVDSFLELNDLTPSVGRSNTSDPLKERSLDMFAPGKSYRCLAKLCFMLFCLLVFYVSSFSHDIMMPEQITRTGAAVPTVSVAHHAIFSLLFQMP